MQFFDIINFHLCPTNLYIYKTIVQLILYRIFYALYYKNIDIFS